MALLKRIKVLDTFGRSSFIKVERLGKKFVRIKGISNKMSITKFNELIRARDKIKSYQYRYNRINKQLGLKPVQELKFTKGFFKTDVRTIRKNYKKGARLYISAKGPVALPQKISDRIEIQAIKEYEEDMAHMKAAALDGDARYNHVGVKLSSYEQNRSSVIARRVKNIKTRLKNKVKIKSTGKLNVV